MLLDIFADGSRMFPVLICQGQREPTVSDFGSVIKVFDVVEEAWKVYSCAENASVDILIFSKWVCDFIPRAREHVAYGE